MYFWNANALAEDLKQGRLSEREKMKYFLVFSLFVTITSYASWEANILVFLEALILVAMTIWGTLFCYKANQKGDDKAFIERFVAMNLPLTIRLIVMIAVPATVIRILLSLVAEELFPPESYTIFDLVFVVLASAIFYWWMRSYFLKISGAVKSLSGKENKPR